MNHFIEKALNLPPIDQIGFVVKNLEASIRLYDPFFGPFSGTLKNHNLQRHWCQMGSKLEPKGALFGAFFEQTPKTEKCVSTAPACTDCIWTPPVEHPGRPKSGEKNRSLKKIRFFSAVLHILWI